MKTTDICNQYKFIIDFDGTISLNDSTTMLAEKYVPELHKKYYQEIKAGNIFVREYIKDQLEAIQMTKEEYINTLRNEMQIDLSFKNFFKKNWNFLIVSTGTVQNVFYSLKENGILIPKNKIISNQLNFNGNVLKVEAPQLYSHQSNGIDKAQIVKDYQQRGYQVIFVGDSISDFEGAKVSDIVYAKKNQQLATYLKKQKIPFFGYENFDEIVNHFQRYFN